ncbi:tachykinin-like peptides receptor 86C [Tachypleus tridentatus]|uniref:tachykinin-like peptides receptor 86C n=1 Tax=Tachypleus tridentatus TaxID=6853 RepID=UPI003FD0FE80
MITMATGGNIVVVWIVVAHRQMRTVTNYFLLNLAVADLLLADFNAIFNFIYLLGSHWPFAPVYCTISNFIAYITVSTSVFSIAAMSIDRYVAIVHPLTPRMSKKSTFLLTGLIWACSVLLALPTLLYSTTSTYQYVIGGDRTLCYLRWPDGPLSKDDYIYNVFFMVLTYVIPMMAMLITYTKMGLVLWGSGAIGETTEHQKNIVLSKRKVVRMLVAVALIFAICWLPYHVYFIYVYHHPKILKTDHIQHVYLAFYWLAMSNSTYNPIVYYYMNNRFKRYFRKVLYCFRKTRENVPCPARSSIEGSATRLRSFTRTIVRKSTLSKACEVNKMKTNDLIDDV